MKVRNLATTQSALRLRCRRYVWGLPVIMGWMIMGWITESSGFGGAAHPLSISCTVTPASPRYGTAVESEGKGSRRRRAVE